MSTNEEKSFGFLVHDVARLMSKKFDHRARELRLSLAQCRALNHIRQNEGIHQARLAELLEIEPISLARLLDRMAAAGWIERKPDPADRRAWRLFLTQQALPIFDDIRTLAAELRAQAFAGLEAEEVESLMALMGRIHLNLNGSQADREPPPETRRESARPREILVQGSAK